MSARLVALVPAMAVLSLSVSAAADWPTARHDPSRTAEAGGVSNIAAPDVFWRYYLGGKITLDALRAVDVAKEGKAAIVFASAGRVTAKRPDNSVIWQSIRLDVNELIDVQDLDGDGTLDVIARSNDRVFVLAGDSGKVEWAEVEGEMGTIGSVRVGDFDGDGKPDLFVMECGCCGVKSGKTGFLYTFKGGFAAVTRLWTLPAVSCASFFSAATFRPRSDGALDVVLGLPTELDVIDGKTGASVASVPVGYPGSFNECMPADVDGRKGEEVLCVGRQAGTGRWHHVFALKFDDASSPPTLSILWDKDIGETNGAVDLMPGGAVDLDGDGLPEVVASGRSSAGAFTTYVLDGATGTSIGTAADNRVIGVAKLRTDAWTVLTGAAGDSLRGWKFNRAAGLVPFWNLDRATAPTYPGLEAPRSNTLHERTVATDIDGDGSDDLLVFRGLPSTRIEAYSETTVGLSLMGSVDLPTGTSSVLAWVVPPAGAGNGMFAVARNDGLLQVFDGKMSSSGGGLTYGGFFSNGVYGELGSTPVVASIGAKAQSVLVTDSRGSLVRLDPAVASNTAPPLPVWTRTDTRAPTVASKLDGAGAGIVCQALHHPLTEPVVHEVVVLHPADGNAVWASALDDHPFHDPLAADVNGDGVPDVVTQWGFGTDTLMQTRAFDGTTGAVLWNATPIDPGSGRQPRGFALKDWNGDGSADVVFQAAATRVLSGTDGSQIAVGTSLESYDLPTIADVDGDGVDEVTLHAGSAPARTLRHDLSTVLWTGPADTPYPAGAIAHCPDHVTFVEGSGANPSTLRLTVMAGPSVGTSKSFALAGGAKYVDEATAVAAGAFTGQLSSASVHANLDGSGKPTALVGSTDGFLYGIDPCSGTMRFSRDLRAPVGEVVYGDTDGDGNDEILVTVADGYLYDLKAQTLPAPTNVIDLDPDHGATSMDVDVTLSASSLTGKWDPVDGADSYEITAVGPDGNYLTSPPWTDVGKVTEGRLDKLALVPRAKYLFGVRAKSLSKGSGPDGTSNGVAYVVDGDAGPSPDAGPLPDAVADSGDSSATPRPDTGVTDADGAAPSSSSGCGCRVAGEGASSSLVTLVALTGAVALVTRRRRWSKGTRHPKSR